MNSSAILHFNNLKDNTRGGNGGEMTSLLNSNTNHIAGGTSHYQPADNNNSSPIIIRGGVGGIDGLSSLNDLINNETTLKRPLRRDGTLEFDSANNRIDKESLILYNSR